MLKVGTETILGIDAVIAVRSGLYPLLQPNLFLTRYLN